MGRAQSRETTGCQPLWHQGPEALLQASIFAWWESERAGGQGALGGLKAGTVHHPVRKYFMILSSSAALDGSPKLLHGCVQHRSPVEKQ